MSYIYNKIFGVKEEPVQVEIAPAPTPKRNTVNFRILSGATFVIFFIIAFFVFLCFEVISQSKQSDRASGDFIKHKKIRNTAAETYTHKIFNVEEIELNPEIGTQTEAKSRLEDPAELLWKQFSRHQDTVLKQVELEHSNKEKTLTKETEKNRLLDKVLSPKRKRRYLRI